LHSFFILEFSPFAFLMKPLLSSLTPYQSTFFEPPLRIWSRVLPSPSLFGELFHNTTPINIIIQSFRLKFFDPLLSLQSTFFEPYYLESYFFKSRAPENLIIQSFRFAPEDRFIWISDSFYYANSLRLIIAGESKADSSFVFLSFE